jgi:two-component system sensor histidine kinase ChiS
MYLILYNRTPLNGIIGIAESMIDGATGHLQNNTINSLSLIINSGRRLANLVNDILGMNSYLSEFTVLQL